MLNSCFKQAMDKNVEIHFLSGKNAFSYFSVVGRPANASLTGDGPIVILEPDMSGSFY